MRYIATPRLQRRQYLGSAAVRRTLGAADLVSRTPRASRMQQECEHAAPPAGCKWVSDGTPCGVNLVCPQSNTGLVQNVTIAPAPLPPAIVPIVSSPSAAVTAQQQEFAAYYSAWQSYVAGGGTLTFNQYLQQIMNGVAPTVPASSTSATTTATSTIGSSIQGALANIPLWGWALGAGALVYAFSGKKGRW